MKEKDVPKKKSRSKALKLRDVTNVLSTVTDSPISRFGRRREPPTPDKEDDVSLLAETEGIGRFLSKKRFFQQDTPSRKMFQVKKRKHSTSLVDTYEDIPSSVLAAAPIIQLESPSSPQGGFINHGYILITEPNPQVVHRSFRSISPATLSMLITDMTEEQFSRRFNLIDCRYPYEYDGGHIKYAVNMYDTNLVLDVFFPEDHEEFLAASSRIPIFYCEYSQLRGPNMARKLRDCDRRRNGSSQLVYEQIYLLDRGYRNFYGFQKDICLPHSYVQMEDKLYSAERQKYKFHHSRISTGEVKRPLRMSRRAGAGRLLK